MEARFAESAALVGPSVRAASEWPELWHACMRVLKSPVVVDASGRTGSRATPLAPSVVFHPGAITVGQPPRGPVRVVPQQDGTTRLIPE